MTAIERLDAAAFSLCGCAGRSTHRKGCKYVSLVNDLAAVEALYQAAKSIADYDPFSKNAATEWGDRRRALEAAVRRVEAAQ